MPQSKPKSKHDNSVDQPSLLGVRAQYMQSSFLKRCLMFLGISALVTSLLLMVAFATVHKGSIQERWSQTITRQPERFTELYFSHPETLPIVYAPKQEIPISVTIRNQEYRTVTYTYRLYVNGVPQLTRQVVVKQGQAVPLTVQAQMPDAAGRIQIALELPDQNQAVHVWVEPQP